MSPPRACMGASTSCEFDWVRWRKQDLLTVGVGFIFRLQENDAGSVFGQSRGGDAENPSRCGLVVRTHLHTKVHPSELRLFVNEGEGDRGAPRGWREP